MIGRRLVLAFVCSVPLLVAAAPAPEVPEAGPPVLPRWEYAEAQIELNRIRMLAQRLSKQNALYQLNLANPRKRDAVATADTIDAALVALQQGRPARAIPVPPTAEVRRAIEALDEAWSPLRQLALASPFDYKRGTAPTGADPLLLGRFDQLVSEFDERAVEASEAYLGLCKQEGYPECETVVRATTSGMLSERLVKEAALVVAGLAVDQNSERLRVSIETLSQALALAAGSEQVQSAMSPERGRVGVVVGEVWSDIDANFERLRRALDRVLAGEAGPEDLEGAMRVQELLLTDMQRFSFAVRRFAAQRRALAAVAAGPP
ncbi:MAG: type IV pili methyl-accepting chemotaxis transducer N-terminal domain-containing protein [Myxococcota bacterium]|nr:type IV pili methyl-accepting chemotaxis transducer N-terminal domain-containing protein [Myxococcota bacterium]